MFVKILNTKKGLFIEDEIGRHLGYVKEFDFYDCVINEDQVKLEDDEWYWEVDKSLLLAVLF